MLAPNSCEAASIAFFSHNLRRLPGSSTQGHVNYAVKSSFLPGFLESVPEVAAKLKEPNTRERKFEDVVKEAEQAAVLVY